MTGPEAVACQQVVAAPPAEVFRWFVDPALLARWIGIRAILEPRPGGSFRFEIADGEWCSGRYLEVTPGRRVVFTWGWDSGAIPVPPGSSTVQVDLEPHPDGTLVRLVHRDLAPELRPLHAEGWARFLPRLAAVVAGRHPLPYPTTRPIGGAGSAPRTPPDPSGGAGSAPPNPPRPEEVPWPSTPGP